MENSTFVLDSTSSSVCLNISTFPDQFIEGNETFTVNIRTQDSAVTVGPFAQIIIVDVSIEDIVASLDNDTYKIVEGETISVCVEISSDVTNLQRDVVLTLVTSEITAEGDLGL